MNQADRDRGGLDSAGGAGLLTWRIGGFATSAEVAARAAGHGIGVDVAGGQLVQLLARRPGLAAFVRRRGDAITAFNPRDRCWFLADDGLCRIEVEDGRAAKPASCRLFPFNRVFRIGAYTIVDYNSVICPLTVGDGGITHADVLAEIEGIADPAVGTVLPARDAEAEGRALVADEGSRPRCRRGEGGSGRGVGRAGRRRGACGRTAATPRFARSPGQAERAERRDASPRCG